MGQDSHAASRGCCCGQMLRLLGRWHRGTVPGHAAAGTPGMLRPPSPVPTCGLLPGWLEKDVGPACWWELPGTSDGQDGLSTPVGTSTGTGPWLLDRSCPHGCRAATWPSECLILAPAGPDGRPKPCSVSHCWWGRGAAQPPSPPPMCPGTPQAAASTGVTAPRDPVPPGGVLCRGGAHLGVRAHQWGPRTMGVSCAAERGQAPWGRCAQRGSLG